MFAIRSAGAVIGHSELEHWDLSMAIVHGGFRPTGAYERVRPVFRLFAEGRTAEYYRARDRLALELVARDGTVVPTETVHIVDFAEEAGPDAYEAQAILRDAAAWPPSGHSIPHT
jgi:hypothetical protein